MAQTQFSPYPQLMQMQRVVAIGGGHGLGRVLSALKFLGTHLTGIVTTTDNGGSTGRIRKQQGGIAWGDLRNCLNQIITEPSTASALFEYRFAGEGELQGHNLGNLMLKALENMQIRPTEAVNLVRELLNVKAQILPMSESPLHLAATLENGQSLVGEVSIDQLKAPPKMLFILPLAPATPEALEAISQADLILFGPGSFLTSILPPLLLPDLALALSKSRAKKIFIDNLGTETGPASQLKLKDKLQWLNAYLGEKTLDGAILDQSMETECHRKEMNAYLYAYPLRADDVAYRHDRTHLCQAIENILAELQEI